MGFLHHKLLIILNKTFSFAQMDGPEAPITSSLISVEVIDSFNLDFYSFDFYSWHFVPKHILSYKNCVFHHLILLCTKKTSTQITESDMMRYPSLRKSPLTQAKRLVFSW